MKGQGVPELETLTANHHLRPSDEQKAMLEKAVFDLRKQLEEMV
ncbi:hypothetical protein [uncultured Streptococcus sp.]|nr:hypothetical protein [uncultured Streptococcus sp.]